MSYLNYLREHYKRFFNFQMVAWSGTVVNLVVLWLLHGVLGWHLLISGAIAIETAIITNFILYFYFTWGERRKSGKRNFFRKLIRYNLITASIDFIVRLTVLWVLTEWIGIYYLLSDIIGMTVTPFFKYYANDHLIFKQSSEPQTENTTD
jgi:dolichol-phosphate mannosyltransferase